MIRTLRGVGSVIFSSNGGLDCRAEIMVSRLASLCCYYPTISQKRYNGDVKKWFKQVLLFCYLVALFWLSQMITVKSTLFPINGLTTFTSDAFRGCGNHWSGLPFAFIYIYKNVPPGTAILECASGLIKIAYWIDVIFWFFLLAFLSSLLEKPLRRFLRHSTS